MINDLRQKALSEGVPIVREQTAKFLARTVAKLNPERILEIGSGVGYSTILLKTTCPNAEVITLEKDEKRIDEALENFSAFDLDIKLISGDAGEVLKVFCEIGQKFDFIFLDGAKGQYIKYLPDIKQLLNKNGVLFADNVLFHGLVKGPEKVAHKHRTMVVNLRKFLDEVENDERFDCKIIEIDDGILIAKKKKI